MMFYVIFTLFGLGLASTIPSPHPFSDEYIQEINAKQSTWVAGKNFEEEDYDLFKVLASGAKRPSSIQSRLTVVHDEDEEVPDTFDSREAWPNCAEIIGQIRDQSRCGACWVSVFFFKLDLSLKRIFFKYRLLLLLKQCLTEFAFTLMVKEKFTFLLKIC